MEFRLIYRGELPSNGAPRDKHRIRLEFHEQLKELWKLQPLKGCIETEGFLKYPKIKPTDYSAITQLNNFYFAHLVTSQLAMFAELEITLLRPGLPGGIVGQSGDIDNQLKTLFDALRIPREAQEIPSGTSPNSVDAPIFCLLEDDRLISKVSVITDRLLIPSPPNEVLVLIQVKVKGSMGTWGNLSLIT